MMQFWDIADKIENKGSEKLIDIQAPKELLPVEVTEPTKEERKLAEKSNMFTGATGSSAMGLVAGAIGLAFGGPLGMAVGTLAGLGSGYAIDYVDALFDEERTVEWWNDYYSNVLDITDIKPKDSILESNDFRQGLTKGLIFNYKELPVQNPYIKMAGDVVSDIAGWMLFGGGNWGFINSATLLDFVEHKYGEQEDMLTAINKATATFIGGIIGLKVFPFVADGIIHTYVRKAGLETEELIDKLAFATITSEGLGFALWDASQQVYNHIVFNEPIDWESIAISGGIGMAIGRFMRYTPEEIELMKETPSVIEKLNNVYLTGKTAQQELKESIWQPFRWMSDEYINEAAKQSFMITAQSEAKKIVTSKAYYMNMSKPKIKPKEQFKRTRRTINTSRTIGVNVSRR